MPLVKMPPPMALRMPLCSVSHPRWLGRQVEQSGHVQAHTPSVVDASVPSGKESKGHAGLTREKQRRWQRDQRRAQERKDMGKAGARTDKNWRQKGNHERDTTRTKTSMDHALSRHHHQAKGQSCSSGSMMEVQLRLPPLERE